MHAPNLSRFLTTAVLVLVNAGAAATEFPPIKGATIKKVMVHGGVAGNNFGGCMANLTLPTTRPATVWPAACVPAETNAKDPWVTFSCTGTLATNTLQSYRLLDQAQLALAANKKVDIWFTDDKENGYCFAYRIDVIK
jgi:hypothetical protein